MTKPYVRQFLPASYKTPQAKTLAAILNAIEANEEYLEQFLIAYQNNLFESRADFSHFLKLLSAQGVTLPSGSGLSFQSFRLIAPLVAHLPKQINSTASALIETFFGLGLTHPSVISGRAENYSLQTGDDLVVETDAGTVTVAVDASVFSDPRNVSAAELAAYLTGAQNLFLCDAYVNRNDGKTYIRLLSKGSGQGDWIAVKGGTLQNSLLFPPVVDTANTFQTQFRLVKSVPYTDVLRVEWADPDNVRFERINLTTSTFNIGLHGLANNTTVTFTSDGTLPAPLALNTTYHVINSTDNAFRISATSGGPFITLTDKGSADFHYVKRVLPTNSATDPQLYKLQTGDIVSIRGLFDVGVSGVLSVQVVDDQGNDVVDFTTGLPVVIDINYNAGNYSVLNGSRDVSNVGRDYFYIQVRGLELQGLPPSTGTLVQLGPKDVVFTRPFQHRVYAQDEYVTISETEAATLTVTVPAVPPIVKRFLQGSMNIAGTDNLVSGFSRTTMDVTGTTPISNGSSVYLSSNQVDADFVGKPLKMVTQVGPTYIIDDADLAFDVLPFTTSTPIGVNDPFEVTLDSDLIGVTFTYRHGFKVGQAVSINGATANFGYSVNGEWIVVEVPSEYKLVFKQHTAVYAGRVVPLALQTASVINVTGRADHADVAIVFPSPAALAPLGVEVGKAVKLSVTGSEVVIAPVAWAALVRVPLIVTEVSGSTVYARSNVSYPFALTVATGVKFRIPKTNFGNAFARHFLNLTPSPVKLNLLDGYNYDRLIRGLFVQVLGYPAAAVTNANWQGPFIYDPFGETGIRYQVGQPFGTLSSPIVIGSNNTTISLTSSGTLFSDSGYLVLSYGGLDAEGPIRYTSVTTGSSLTTIELDPSYTFSGSHALQAQVREVVSLEPHQPLDNGQDFTTYLTSAAPTREALFTYLKQILSVSVFVEQDLRLPQVLWQDAGIPVYD